MSIFPFISYENEEISSSNTIFPIYREVAFDFDNSTPIISNGDLKIVEGNEAIKVWVYKAINTVRYEHSIYSWGYGCEATNLIGKGYTQGLTKSEAERYIKECILINPYITNVEIIDINFTNNMLTCDIKINTVYGEVSINV
jgi:hypothetical protein